MKVEAHHAKPVNNLGKSKGKTRHDSMNHFNADLETSAGDWSVMLGVGPFLLLAVRGPVPGKITRKMRLLFDGFFRGPRAVACAGAWKRKELTGKHRQTHDFS